MFNIKDMQEDFIKELKELMEKYHAWIEVDTDCGYFRGISVETMEKEIFYTKNVIIGPENLESDGNKSIS